MAFCKMFIVTYNTSILSSQEMYVYVMYFKNMYVSMYLQVKQNMHSLSHI